MEKCLRIGLLLVLLIVVGLIPVSGIRADNSDAKALFEKRCSLCHPTSRALSASKSGEEWLKTVNRMNGYASGRISDKDAGIVTEYLTEIRVVFNILSISNLTLLIDGSKCNQE